MTWTPHWETQLQGGDPAVLATYRQSSAGSLEARVAAIFSEAALPRHAAIEVIRVVRSQIERDIEALHIPGAPCVGDESYNAAIADAARIARAGPS